MILLLTDFPRMTQTAKPVHSRQQPLIHLRSGASYFTHFNYILRKPQHITSQLRHDVISHATPPGESDVIKNRVLSRWIVCFVISRHGLSCELLQVVCNALYCMQIGLGIYEDHLQSSWTQLITPGLNFVEVR
jgi:hypothetical protein